MNRIEEIKSEFELKPHPEGGYYRRVYTSDHTLDEFSLPISYTGERPLMTSVLYLLPSNSYSRFHKIKSDEIWHYYEGNTLTLHLLSEKNGYEQRKLGTNFDSNELPQITIPSNTWFAATHSGEYTLSGCTVAPGFSFKDWELGDQEILQDMFPEKKELISRFS